jgi:glucose 1-dehydrogenase
LVQQKAPVTGGNSGIGEGCAIALGAAGATFVVHYLSDAAGGERVVAAIKQASGETIALQADLSREDPAAGHLRRWRDDALPGLIERRLRGKFL